MSGGDEQSGGAGAGERARRAMTVGRALVEKMYAHARARTPAECCGLVGGRRGGEAQSVYRTRNVAPDPLVSYEAAPRDLFRVQRRLMPARGEELVGIYHSHPREADPVPSPTDVRLAFEPEAVYFIIGFAPGGGCVLRAFRIFREEGRWERAACRVVEW